MVMDEGMKNVSYTSPIAVLQRMNSLSFPQIVLTSPFSENPC